MRRRIGPTNPNISRSALMGRDQKGPVKTASATNVSTGLLGKGGRNYRGWMGATGASATDEWMTFAENTKTRRVPDAPKVKDDE